MQNTVLDINEYVARRGSGRAGAEDMDQSHLLSPRQNTLLSGATTPFRAL